jgi:hypothetical protein
MGHREGKDSRRQGGHGQDFARPQGSWLGVRGCECSQSAVSPQITLAIMGRLEWKEMPGTVPSGVQRGSRGSPVRQTARAGPVREEEGVGAEQTVPVLSEACCRAGVLRARRLLKAKCMRPGCNGEHAVGAHRLLGESDACVNLTTGGDYKSEEEEEWWVNTVSYIMLA